MRVSLRLLFQYLHAQYSNYSICIGLEEPNYTRVVQVAYSKSYWDIVETDYVLFEPGSMLAVQSVAAHLQTATRCSRSVCLDSHNLISVFANIRRTKLRAAS